MVIEMVNPCQHIESFGDIDIGWRCMIFYDSAFTTFTLVMIPVRVCLPEPTATQMCLLWTAMGHYGSGASQMSSGRRIRPWRLSWKRQGAGGWNRVFDVLRFGSFLVLKHGCINMYPAFKFAWFVAAPVTSDWFWTVSSFPAYFYRVHPHRWRGNIPRELGSAQHHVAGGVSTALTGLQGWVYGLHISTIIYVLLESTYICVCVLYYGSIVDASFEEMGHVASRSLGRTTLQQLQPNEELLDFDPAGWPWIYEPISM